MEKYIHISKKGWRQWWFVCSVQVLLPFSVSNITLIAKTRDRWVSVRKLG